MDCKHFQDHVDDYADGLLHEDLQRQAMQHLEICSDCREHLAEHQELLQVMKDLPVPQMRPGFMQQALKRATEQKSHHRRGFVKGFSSALVAGLVLWTVTFLMLPDQEAMQGDVAQVMLTLHEERTINLVFEAPDQLAEAKVTLILPANVEVVGFPGQREIAWRTPLNKGKNILPLPLKANGLVDDQLVARIESGTSKKTFVIKISGVEDGRSTMILKPDSLV